MENKVPWNQHNDLQSSEVFQFVFVFLFFFLWKAENFHWDQIRNDFALEDQAIKKNKKKVEFIVIAYIKPWNMFSVWLNK